MVVSSIKARFSDAKLLSAEKGIENGRFVYEVKIRTGGFKKEVDVTPEGRIVDVDDEDD